MEKYTQKINIQSYHTDQYGKASVCSLFNFMLEAAWAHAQVMEWGYDQLQNHHMFWVLSRMYIIIEKYPSWQNQITIHTWPAGTDGMYAYREFIIEGENGEVVLRANTAWLILDIHTKKIILLKEYIHTFPRYAGTSACREPERLRPYKNAEHLSFSPILFSELDINKHFNSVKALERVIDHFGIIFLNQYEPETIEVNYLKEGLAGDSLAVSSLQTGDGNYQSSIIRETDLVTLSSTKIHWRPRHA
ncbi:MAG: acyl-[acyl-carrier-protein] thioesterase [Mangrovibacterium sp.]